MDFSGKELIKGEPDASISHPEASELLEARGYHMEPDFSAFIKDKDALYPNRVLFLQRRGA